MKRSSYLTSGLGLLLCAQLARAENAITWEVAYTGDYLSNTSGGVAQKDAYLDNLDLTLEVDMDKACNYQGGTFFVYGLANNNKTFSDKVGDAQVTSNIDNEDVVRLYELWYEQAFRTNSFKLGLIDLNSEFDAIEPAGLFMNSSHGIGPDYSQSGVNGPSIFPSTSLGFRYFQEMGERFSLRTAVFDAVPGDPNEARKNSVKLNSDEGALLALEVNYKVNRLRYALGTWLYTQDTPTMTATTSKKNSGYYGFVEHVARLSSWLRIGCADSEINQFSFYTGAGCTYKLFPESRPDDLIGLAVARVENSEDYQKTGAFDTAETNFELTYQAPICKVFTIQPNVQYILNPGMDPALNNALVVGLRCTLAFGN